MNNRNYRARPVGWRNESHRHYLASKGIATKRYMYTDRHTLMKRALINSRPYISEEEKQRREREIAYENRRREMQEQLKLAEEEKRILDAVYDDDGFDYDDFDEEYDVYGTNVKEQDDLDDLKRDFGYDD